MVREKKNSQFLDKEKIFYSLPGASWILSIDPSPPGIGQKSLKGFRMSPRVVSSRNSSFHTSKNVGSPRKTVHANTNILAIQLWSRSLL